MNISSISTNILMFFFLQKSKMCFLTIQLLNHKFRSFFLLTTHWFFPTACCSNQCQTGFVWFSISELQTATTAIVSSEHMDTVGQLCLVMFFIIHVTQQLMLLFYSNSPRVTHTLHTSSKCYLNLSDHLPGPKDFKHTGDQLYYYNTQILNDHIEGLGLV